MIKSIWKYSTPNKMLVAIGITIGLVHRWPTGKLALRGAGALIAIMGIFFLWQAVV